MDLYLEFIYLYINLKNISPCSSVIWELCLETLVFHHIFKKLQLCCVFFVVSCT